MTKIVLQDTNSGHNLQTINDNFRKIEDEFNKKVLYRDNPVGEPNEMESDLDMNSHRIYNLPEPVFDHEAARKKDIGNAPLLAKQYAEEAKDWAEAAEDTFDDVVDALLAGTDYLGEYLPNLVIDSPLQLFWRDGAYYRISGDIALPYTTTGDWDDEESLFVEIGDASLRQELASGTGADMVGLGDAVVSDLLSRDDAQKGSALLGYLPGFPGSVGRSVADRLSDFIPSAKDFGAVGDGVHDDTDAIQAAIDAAGKVFIPYTDEFYRITKPLYMGPGNSIEGESGRLVRIVKDTSTRGAGENLARGGVVTDSYDVDAAIIVTHPDNNYATYVSIKNLAIENKRVGAWGIYAPRMYVSQLENLVIDIGDGECGYRTHDTFMTSFKDVQIRGNYNGILGSVGFWFEDRPNDSTGTSCHFTRCWVRDGIEVGYRFRGVVYSDLTSCGVDRFTKHALWMELCDINIGSFGFENRVTPGDDAIVSRYSRVTANTMVAFTVNTLPGKFLFNLQGSRFVVGSMRHSANDGAGSPLRAWESSMFVVQGVFAVSSLLTENYSIEANSYFAGTGRANKQPYENLSGSVIGTVGDSGGDLSVISDTTLLRLGADKQPRLYVGNGFLRPTVDNNTSLGQASHRFTTVYAGNGTINTSDGREKQQVRELSDAERRVATRLKGLVRAFKFNDAVDKKGDGSARIHFGVIAQDVRMAFEDEGLDAHSYGMFCYDEWPETPEELDSEGEILTPYIPAGNRYGVRYDQLLAFIISAL